MTGNDEILHEMTTSGLQVGEQLHTSATNTTVEVDIPPSNVPPDVKPFIGQVFDDIERAHAFYNTYAQHKGFSIRKMGHKKDDKTKVKVYQKFCCSKEGEKRSNKNNSPKKPSAIREPGVTETVPRRTKCQASINLNRNRSGEWAVTKLNEEHNHEMAPKKMAHTSATISTVEVDLPSPNVPPDVKPFIGQVFDNIERAHAFYNMYAQYKGFSIRKMGHKKDKTKVKVYQKFCCSKEGEKRSNKNNSLKTPSAIREPGVTETAPRRTNCQASINLSRNRSGEWVVTKLNEEHNHEMAPKKMSHFLCSQRHMPNETRDPMVHSDATNVEHNKQVGILQCQYGGTMTSMVCLPKDLENSKKTGKVIINEHLVRRMNLCQMTSVLAEKACMSEEITTFASQEIQNLIKKVEAMRHNSVTTAQSSQSTSLFMQEMSGIKIPVNAKTKVLERGKRLKSAAEKRLQPIAKICKESSSKRIQEPQH